MSASQLLPLKTRVNPSTFPKADTSWQFLGVSDVVLAKVVRIC